MLFPLALIFIFPFVQMVFASLMTPAEINAYPPTLFPHHPTLAGLPHRASAVRLPDLVQESVIVTTVAVDRAAPALPARRLRLRAAALHGHATLQLLLLTTVFIPPQLLMIPVYKMYTALGIVGTLPSLFLPWMATRSASS